MKKLLLLISVYALSMQAMDRDTIAEKLSKAQRVRHSAYYDPGTDYEGLASTAQEAGDTGLAFDVRKFVALRSNEKKQALRRLREMIDNMPAGSEREKYEYQFSQLLNEAYTHDLNQWGEFLWADKNFERAAFVSLLVTSGGSKHTEECLARAQKKDPLFLARLRTLIDHSEQYEKRLK